MLSNACDEIYFVDFPGLVPEFYFYDSVFYELIYDFVRQCSLSFSFRDTQGIYLSFAGHSLSLSDPADGLYNAVYMYTIIMIALLIARVLHTVLLGCSFA